jgi:aryl-alcohol dehydrogenase-like predicted oxidoreductase
MPTIPRPIGATKWCVFRSPPTPYSRKYVEEAVRERMSRTLSDGIDIFQFHWQDYDDPGYMDVIQHLLDIKRDGTLRIDELGLVNFDSRRVDEICRTFGPGALVTNQVQVCGCAGRTHPPNAEDNFLSF